MLSTKSKRFFLGMAAAAGAIVLAACGGSASSSSDSGGGTAANGSASSDATMSIAVVTHGSASDSFWNVVKRGATDAGKQLGVNVTYNSDGDPGQQSKLIDDAIARHVDGIVVSMADPEALKTSVKNAVKAGIPVVTINSGAAESAAFGAIAHVGQDETIAGRQAGARLKAAGKTTLLCVIHESGNVGLDQRCDGAKQGFDGQVATLQVDINNPTDAEAKIKEALRNDPSIDAVLTLNPQVALSAVNAVRESGSKAVVATFDLDSDMVSAIKSGQVSFAVDQQQYEQGYLPIVILKLFHDNANTVGGGQPVLTGPGFVDQSNVDNVTQYALRGTR